MKTDLERKRTISLLVEEGIGWLDVGTVQRTTDRGRNNVR